MLGQVPLEADEHAERFIEENKDNPFLLYLPFYSVHTPIQAKPELIAKYEAKAKMLGLPKPFRK